MKKYRIEFWADEDAVAARHSLSENVELTVLEDCIKKELKTGCPNFTFDSWIDECDRVIALAWCIEDVREVVSQRDKQISDTDAKKVLRYLDHKHDATIGISWDVIDTVVDMLLWDEEIALTDTEEVTA